MSSLSSITQFSFIITSLVTVVGWFFVASMADRREFRKEVREHIKDLRSKCDSVRELTAKYWVESDGKSAAANAAALKAAINSLFRQVRILAEVGLSVDDSLLVAIRQSATGGDFEKKGRRKTGADSLRLLDAGQSLDDLAEAIDKAFYNRFKPVKPRKLKKKFALSGVLLLAQDKN